MLRLAILLAGIALVAYLFDRRLDPKRRMRVMQGILALVVSVVLAATSYLVWSSIEERRLATQARVSFVSIEPGEQIATIRFEICNDRRVALRLTSFVVAGFEDGRSTPHRILKGRRGRTTMDTELDSDLIVAPRSCELDSWQGHFLEFDRYEVLMISAEWEDSKKVRVRLK